ncbi:hypothetical protein [Paenibacillus sp. KS-LC4]|uniref:hypothetical protein n=1 Tax=Paenibacillus sp. KS-LC4 TaxID=2979727 RepID=UPI0030CFACB8
MKNDRRWTLSVLTATALLLLLTAFINYKIDPYGLYHFSGESYNYRKSINRDPYQFKTYHSKRLQPQAIVLGTSRAMRLDPAFIQSLTGEVTYNLGLPAATPYSSYQYLKYMLKVNPQLNTVYLGLDFEVFDDQLADHVNYVEKRLTSPFYITDYFSTLLSEPALKESWKIWYDNHNHTTTYSETRYLQDGSFDENYVYPANINEGTLNILPTTLELSSNSLDVLKRITQLCEQNHLQLYLYISPVHAIVLETYWQNSLWPQYEEWKRQLVNIAPIWDFTGYHNISTSSLQTGENYNDLSHFSKKIGNLILERMLNLHDEQVPSYFGVLLTTDNVEEHLKELRQNRERWPEKNKKMADLLASY